MLRAAFQRPGVGACFFFVAVIGGGAFAATEGIRVAPTRPGAPGAVPTVSTPVTPLATRKFAGVDYVSVADGAKQLGLNLAWLARGRRLALTDGALRADLEKDERDITVNGLRVFLGDPVLDAGGQLYVSRIDYERCLTPMLRPGFGVPAAPPPKIIVLDPGHGGRDRGTSLNEKTYALDVARRARKILEAAGYRVVLTRDDDTFIELSRRAAIANVNHADAFVSIHFNALANDAKTSGVEVYTFPPVTQHAAVWWSGLKKADPDLETTAQPVNRFDHWNVVLAQAVHRHFIVDLKSFDRGKKLMHLGVLRALNCPGVLVECGFLTSEIEARKIAAPDYRQKLAEAIAAGVRDYAATLGARPKSPGAANSDAGSTR
jgi:N-acetylmuramoyl-L-alanine amidase